MAVGELFNPRSIALVGATDKPGWSASTPADLRTHGFAGSVHLVNPRGGVVHGLPAHRSRVATLAESLGDDLESLENSPLLVAGSRVVALDVLITWHP